MIRNIVGMVCVVFLLIGCKKDNNKIGGSKDAIYLTENALDNFFGKNPASDAIQNEVTLFYKERNAELAWFNKRGMTQAVFNFQNQLLNYSNDFNDQTFNNTQLDSLIAEMKKKRAKKIDVEERENLELLLTATFFKYSKKAFSGVTRSTSKLDWFIPRTKKDYQATLDLLVSEDDAKKTQDPLNFYYFALRAKLKLYRDIQKKGGFPKINMKKEFLAKNETDSILLTVKRRLFLTGDLKVEENNILYTKTLADAVAQFQQRVGLPENGKLDFKTVAELNKTVDFRIRQILINLERIRWMPVDIEKDYILVNVPEYKLHVFENKKLIWEANVVVGKEATQTTIFKGNISKVVLNPYWNVPASIVEEEILPKLKGNSNYLEQNDMEAVSGNKVINTSGVNWNDFTNSVPYNIRQRPGNENALGKMKFLFPNGYNIYLHDTPSKALFDRNKRDFSHGCIRVQDPKKLALYLLRNNKEWNETLVNKTLQTNKETEIIINPKIAVYIAYFTAWVDSQGNLNFRNDIYDLDDELGTQIFAN